MANIKDKLIAGAQKLVEKNQFDKAIKEYLKVVATDDKDVRIWLKIGDLYAKLGKKAEAAETYQKVAEFYSEQGFYLKSVAVYKQILKIDPRLIDVNQRLAELYKQLGLLTDAMQQYETVAAFLHKEGRTKEALAALKQIVDLDPETVANRIKLAELYSKEQMASEAIEEFGRAAQQLKDGGRSEDYMKVAERLLFHSPDNRVVSKELARLYIEKGDPRRGLPKLQVCFKGDPRDPDVLALLAKAFEALDQRQKSVSVLKELARILGENGDRNARDEVYRKILTLAPGDPDAETALGGGGRRRSVTGAQVAREPSVSEIMAPSRAALAAAVAPRPNPGMTGSVPLVDDPPGDEFDDRASAAAGGTGRTAVSALLDVGAGKSPEQAGEQIAKILNETDVYIKYKLYSKAIDHVQRVFELDPTHVEAREKLKALYLGAGKRDEAVLELWALTEQAEPARRRRYLREILELDAGDARAAAMLGMSPGAVPEAVEVEAPSGEALDVDAIEELGDEDFDVADPSKVIDPARAELPSGHRYREEPHGAGDDDLIPLVVEPVTDSAADEPVEVEDRFGFGGDPSPAERRTAAEEDVDLRTRFDDSPLKFLAGEDVDESELPAPPTLAAGGAAVTALGEAPAGLEDDLDEADFFMQQSLFDEAREILNVLLARHPRHPLVTAKLRDIEVMERAASGQPAVSSDEIAAEPGSTPVSDLAAEPPDELPGSSHADDAAVSGDPVYEVTRRGVIEKGVTAEDFETHYDLGIAYKEMGLVDDAITEFKLVMKDPAREVQCHLMIGLCSIEKGQQTEAIGHFKKALYVEGITERESLSLYFELGEAYQRLGDTREALYYYEKVLKRDARFRNVEKVVEDLRSGAPPPAPSAVSPGGDDLDAAFDSLVDGEPR